jgi:hypothetical protein
MLHEESSRIGVIDGKVKIESYGNSIELFRECRVNSLWKLPVLLQEPKIDCTQSLCCCSKSGFSMQQRIFGSLVTATIFSALYLNIWRTEHCLVVFVEIKGKLPGDLSKKAAECGN